MTAMPVASRGDLMIIDKATAGHPTLQPFTPVSRPATPVAGSQRADPGLVAHLCRITNAARTHLERTVLRNEGMRWTAFDALIVVCVRQQVEVRALAAELGIAKATL